MKKLRQVVSLLLALAMLMSAALSEEQIGTLMGNVSETKTVMEDPTQETEVATLEPTATPVPDASETPGPEGSEPPAPETTETPLPEANEIPTPETVEKTLSSDLIDFVIEDGVLTKYTGMDSNVTVPDGVTEIGRSAFQNCFFWKAFNFWAV